MSVVRRCARHAALLVAITVCLGAFVTALSPGASAAETPYNEYTVQNSALANGAAAMGQGRIAEANGRSYLLYTARFAVQPWVRVRDLATGTSTDVSLAPGTTSGTAWARADLAVSGDNLWTFAGAGPVYLRHYRLAGSPLPTSATLVTEYKLGDADSRASGITPLETGGVAAVWHQQGAIGGQGLRIVRGNADGSISGVTQVAIATRSSNQAIVQHPADGSVWLFNSADASGTIGAVHMTDTGSALTVDWSTGRFIDQTKYGTNGPEPSAPDLEAAQDIANGRVALAYQNAERKIFSTEPYVAGSFISIAGIAADGAIAFQQMPTYVERISSIGLTVTSGSTVLTYRPINADLSFNVLHARRTTAGSWEAPVVLGTLADPRSTVYAADTSTNLGGTLSDGQLHLFTDGATTTTEPAPANTTTTTAPSSPKTKGGRK